MTLPITEALVTNLYKAVTINVKAFYTSEYPDDDMGDEITEWLDFRHLWVCLNEGKIYDFIPCDSVIRERLFSKLAQIFEVPYKTIYKIWLTNDSN